MASLYKPSDIVTVGERTQALTKFAAELSTPVQTILGRVKRGWTIEDACTKPLVQSGTNKGRKFDPDILVGDEVERLLAAGNAGETSIRDRVLIVLAYRAGLRCFEILALRPKDVDEKRGTVRIHHGKGDKARVVAMDPAGWAHLLEWMQLRATWSINAETPLFCTRDGGKLGDRQVRAMFSRRAAKAGLSKHVHCHGMRHSMASEMASEGVNLLDISGALGHANVGTTNTYLHKINPTSVVDAMKRRSWGQAGQVTIVTSRQIPEPGWLDRLRADIGPERLQLVHDARADQNEFKAIVLLF